MPEPVPPPEKNAPKPHRHTTAIAATALLASVTALLVSMKSCSIAQNSSEIAAKAYALSVSTSRTAVEITHVEVRNDWQLEVVPVKSRNILRLRYTIENFGKLPTQHLSVRFALTGVFEGPKKDPKFGVAYKKTAADLALPTFTPEDLPPGGTHVVDQDLPTDGLSESLSHDPDFHGRIVGMGITTALIYSDEYGIAAPKLQCFSAVATQSGHIRSGPITQCVTTGMAPVQVVTP